MIDKPTHSQDVKKSILDAMKLITAEDGFGKRLDGTNKNKGFFGLLPRPDGRVSTELSIGVDFDGKEVLIPSLVPTLNKAEVEELLSTDGVPPKDIQRKAAKYAKERISQGKSPFWQSGEKVYPLPENEF